MINKIKVVGKLEIFEDGVKVLEKNNLVVNGGLSHICDRLKNATETVMGYTAVGTDSTAVVATDTTLGAELDRNAAASITAGVGTFIMETLFTSSEAQGVWREVAMFNAASVGTMFNRININYTKGASNVTTRFTITFSTS